jgi:hypothetical protein
VEYDATKRHITRFDAVAIGNHWGESRYMGGARPGKTPLGIAFTLVPADVPANRVPPQGARERENYFGRWR